MPNNQKIPEGWSVKRLGECVEGTQLGGNYENSESNKGLPLIKMGNLSRGKIVLDKIEYIPENTIHNEKDILHYGDLLFNTRNTLELVGKVSIWKNELPTALFNSNILRFTFNPSIIKNSFFMNYYFNSEKGLKLLRARAIGTTSVAAIYWRDCINMKILLPPLAEQEKIALVLGTWDEAIEKLSNLIEQKKNLKKGLMQKLLTGKHRLKGFSSPWHEVKLGDISKISTGESNREDSSLDGKYTFFDRSQEIRTSNRYLFDGEAIIVAGEGQDFIPKYFVGKFDLHQRSYCIMNFKNLSGKFLFFLLNLNKNYFLQQAVGSTVKSLRLPMFLKMKLYIPSDISEQKAIAEILSKADEEIELLNKKLEAFKQEKKALMQQLLTGKIRVKVN